MSRHLALVLEVAPDQDVVAGESFALVPRLRFPDQDEVAGESFSGPPPAARAALVPVDQPSRESRTVCALSPKAVLKSQLRALQQKCCRQQRRIGDLLAQQRDARLALAAAKPLRAHQYQLVAITRNLHSSSCAAAAAWAGTLTGLKVSANSVARHELVCGTSIIAAAQDFHIDMEQAFYENRDCHDSLDFVITDLAGDATKSNPWRAHKLQCLCLRSTFRVAGSLTSKTFWPDVMVADDATAVGCGRLVRKQCRVVQSTCIDPCQAA